MSFAFSPSMQYLLSGRRSKGKSQKDDLSDYRLWIGGSTVLLLLFIVLHLVEVSKNPLDVLVNDVSAIQSINTNRYASWSAGSVSMFDNWTIKNVREMGGVSVSGKEESLPLCAVTDSETPEYFDSRVKWSSCFTPVISQGNCSSSWASVSLSTLANRYCIAEPTKYPGLRLSLSHALQCDTANRGCKGGNIDTIWNFLNSSGVVSNECFSPFRSPQDFSCPSPSCQFGTPSIFKVKSVCAIGGEESIKREISRNGPVIAAVFLNSDFLIYKSGIYRPQKQSIALTDDNPQRNRLLHAVKIVGWGGSEKEGKYWIIENSFGTDWGVGGFGKIVRISMSSVEERTNWLDGPVLLDSFSLAPTPANAPVAAGIGSRAMINGQAKGTGNFLSRPPMISSNNDDELFEVTK